MQFENMREFVVLADTCNYMVAAEELYISQSTLSKHIKEMEHELGIQLFNRSTRKVELTEFGMLFLPYAKDAVKLQDKYTAAASQYLERLKNTISIGTLKNWRETEMAKLTSEFQMRYKDIRVNLLNGESEDLSDMLDSNLCDFIFFREENCESKNGLVKIPFQKDALTACMPKNHHLAGCKSIKLEDLKEESLLLSEKTSLSYKIGTKACREAGFEPNIFFMGNRAHTLSYLSKGLGIALVFGSSFIKPLEADMVAIPIEQPIYSYVNLVYKKDELNEAKNCFLNFIEEYTTGGKPD